MARSFREAFAGIEGPEFDLAVGYTIPPWKGRPTERAMAAAFEGFGSRQIKKIVRFLVAYDRCQESDAEEAVQDALLHLLDNRRDLLRESPERWLRYLVKTARFRLLDSRRSSRRTDSIEKLTATAGDAPFIAAQRCVPPDLDASNDSRYTAAPKRGEDWTATQIIGAFQRFRDFHGRPPKVAECRSVHMLPSRSAIARHFPSFADAVLAAGMVPRDLGRRRKRWSPLEAATACLSFRHRNARWPCRQDTERQSSGLPSASVMKRFFGGSLEAEVQRGAESILFGVEAG
jgi:DNA-directed RNA polymerase specialized sigma24 family protein